MAAQEPQLSVKLSLSEPTYYFTNPTPPTLSLTIESNLDKPITIFTWYTPFNPSLGMVQGCFSIMDLTTNTPVPQTKIQIQRAPFSRARGSYDDHLFLTLYPHTPTVVSTGFGRGGGKFPPDPKAVVERGRVRDENGKELKIRTSTSGCGVDGLEGGHRYRVDVTRSPLTIGRWWWGTKEEVMVEPGGVDWNILPGEEIPLEVGSIEGVEFEVEWGPEAGAGGVSEGGDEN
ncbi:uncharacterized protein LY89DRAFT_687520 [Mollisia scopiformis]|uniref:Uncharacterized protein n=1 Tax=Mollisia scopiformis TaxID=149040 RepID=A0A194WZL8_MOLSC|nr:uncharacterized protein LY89DRAFT_687520 [Mollisia scopiformis]KUJ13388.1 hypothetical protein LY89DRAFT_687520 [Mollisia scopiformis]